MSMPGMDSNNRWSRLVRRVAVIETALTELRSALGTLGSATISGDLKAKGGGTITVTDQGKFLVLGDNTYVQILDDSFSIGTIAGGAFTRPSMIMQPDGFLAAISDTLYAAFLVDKTTGAAVLTSSQGSVRLPYQQTGSAANTRILFDGTIQMVTSSRRYKRDVKTAVIDIADVLKMRGRTWRQRSEVADDPTTDTRYVGFIAEELHALPSLQQFVDYDDQGRPDAIQYDRLTVALLELLKHVHGLVDSLTDRVTELETEVQQLRTTGTDMQAQIDALTRRLDATDKIA